MTRRLLTLLLLASLLPLGGCWLSAGVRAPLGNGGAFVGYQTPTVLFPGPDVGARVGVRVR